MITDEMVEGACVAYVETAFDLHHEIKPTEVERRGMRAALSVTSEAAISLIREVSDEVVLIPVATLNALGERIEAQAAELRRLGR